MTTVKERIFITDHKHQELLADLASLGVTVDGLCAREAYKLWDWHLRGTLDVTRLNVLAGIDIATHKRIGIESYRNTNYIDLRFEE